MKAFLVAMEISFHYTFYYGQVSEDSSDTGKMYEWRQP